MGDPKRIRKKYHTPAKLWQKDRLEEESRLQREYGLKNKKEIWKMDSILKGFTRQAKQLIADTSKQSEVEKNALLKKLVSIGLIEANAKIEDVLSLNIKNILERRLQTFVLRKNMARSISQARQFITHCHVTVSSKVVTAPSYIVRAAEENSLGFIQTSALADTGHIERTILAPKAKPKSVPEKRYRGRSGGRRPSYSRGPRKDMSRSQPVKKTESKEEKKPGKAKAEKAEVKNE